MRESKPQFGPYGRWVCLVQRLDLAPLIPPINFLHRRNGEFGQNAASARLLFSHPQGASISNDWSVYDAAPPPGGLHPTLGRASLCFRPCVPWIGTGGIVDLLCPGTTWHSTLRGEGGAHRALIPCSALLNPTRGVTSSCFTQPSHGWFD